MAFGVFEANLGSAQESDRAKQEFLDKRAAAVYDVREKLGPMLFAAKDVEEFRHLVAMMKHDQSVYKIIGEHLHPSAGVVRSIVGKKSIVEKEFAARLAAGITDFAEAGLGTGSDDTSGPGMDTPSPAPPPATPAVSTGGDNMTPASPMPNSGGGSNSIISPQRAQELSGVSQPETPSTMMAKRRSADFNGENDDLKATFKPSDGELIPKDNWDGYLNSVDQKSDKATSNVFTSSMDFALYRDWCTANRIHPLKQSSLDAYAVNVSDVQYFRLASAIQASAYTDTVFGPGMDPDEAGVGTKKTEHKPPTPKGQPKNKLKDLTASRDPLPRYIAWCQQRGLKRISANNVAYYAGNDTELAIHLAQRMKRAIHTARQRHALEDWEKEYDQQSEEEMGRRHKERGGEGNPDPREFWKDSRRHQACYPGCEKNEAHAKKFHNKDKEASRRQAAPDYLQKADDALTQLLNQKAQEFQETIQPLQQALVTVQQAEQLQQQANPMNVLPAPGTVNVMPQGGGGDANGASVPGQMGMPDPNAPDTSGLAQMLQPGGATPDLGGGAPAGGEDPNAPPPALQQQARLRGGQGKGRGATRPRQAAGYTDMRDPSAYGSNPALHNPNLDTPYTDPGRSLAEQQAARDKAVQEEARAAIQQRKQRKRANSVFDLWHKWQNNRGQSGNLGTGGDYDYESFANEMGVGQKALQKLKQHHTQGVTVARRRQADNPSFLDWAHDTHPGVNLDYDIDGPSRAKIIHEYQLDYDNHTPHNHKYKSKGVGKGKELVSARQRYLAWCERNDLKAANTKNFYWYAASVHPREAALLTGAEHDYDPNDAEQIYAPARGHGWEHKSAPSGVPYDRPQSEHGRHEASRKQAWTGWGPAQFPKARKVAGWDWDNHLNGYTSNAPQHFACACGDQFPTPSGFQRCACGRQWNSYVIGSGGSNKEASAEKFLVREIPVRPDVIVANRDLEGAIDPPTSGHGPEFQDYINRRGDDIQANPQDYPHTWHDFSEQHHVSQERLRTEDAEHGWNHNHANLHRLVDPGELGEGEDDGQPTFKKQPKDWAKRGDGARWTKSPIGA